MTFMMWLILAACVLGGTILMAALFLRRVVPTNMVHIIQSGKSTISYGRGKEAGNTYYEWPTWIPIIGIEVTEFPESIFDVTLEKYDAYDKGRLPFIVDVKAFFRIEHSETAAQRVKDFQELQQQLHAILQGSVRKILATTELEKIMQERSIFGQQFTDEVRAQLVEWGVIPVKNIEFMDIRDVANGNVIANIMAKEKSRIERESREAVAENTRLAETAEVQARREVDLRKQEANQAVGEKTAQAKQAIGVADEKSKQEIAGQAAVTAEKQQGVNRVNEVKQAEIKQSVAVVNAEAAKKVAVTNAEAAKEVLIVTADGEKTSTITEAEGKLQAQLKNAEGIKAEGEAKGSAEQALLMAPVNSQIALAKEIGENEGYQKYLVTVETIRVTGEVGKAQAVALEKADIKVIANGGNIVEGMGSIGGLLSSAGGTKIGAMISGLMQNPDVAALTGKGNTDEKASSVVRVGKAA